MLKEKIYEKALLDIVNASDQANPIQLKAVAQVALDSEPTTADEYNNLDYGFEKDQAEIVEYDRKLSEAASEAAESVWRGTVLSKNYKSPFNEEEE